MAFVLYGVVTIALLSSIVMGDNMKEYCHNASYGHHTPIAFEKNVEYSGEDLLIKEVTRCVFVEGVEAEACDHNDFALQVDANTVRVTRDPAYNSSFSIKLTVYCDLLPRFRRNLQREVDQKVVNDENDTNKETDNVKQEKELNVNKHKVKHNGSVKEEQGESKKDEKYEVNPQKTEPMVQHVQLKHHKYGEHKTEKPNFVNAKGNVLKTKIDVKSVARTLSDENLPEHKVVNYHRKQPERFVRYNRGYVSSFLQNPDKSHQKTFRAHVEAVKAQHNVYRAHHHLEKAERRVVHHQKRAEYALKNEHRSPHHIDRAINKVERALKQVPKAHKNLEKAHKGAVKTAKNVASQSFEYM